MKLQFWRRPEPPPQPSAVPRPEPVVYSQRAGWGMAIDFIGWEPGSMRQSAYGFRPGWDSNGKPREGDLLKAKMQSGKTAFFTLSEVTWHRNPPDMWTGTATFLRYDSEEVQA